jgi:hypothetical protein
MCISRGGGQFLTPAQKKSDVSIDFGWVGTAQNVQKHLLTKLESQIHAHCEQCIEPKFYQLPRTAVHQRAHAMLKNKACVQANQPDQINRQIAKGNEADGHSQEAT